jgi:hypothetical protein
MSEPVNRRQRKRFLFMIHLHWKFYSYSSSGSARDLRRIAALTFPVSIVGRQFCEISSFNANPHPRRLLTAQAQK